GFGSRTGLDLDKETPGVMPDREYYVRRFGAYTPGLVVNNAIGQGDVAVTPLQLAVAYAAIANGGTVYKPQIVREVRDADGTVLSTAQPVVVNKVGLTDSDLLLMKGALSHVAEGGGTAAGLQWHYNDKYKDMSEWLRASGMQMVGKTGTAQVVKLSKTVQHIGEQSVPYEQRDHAWFVGFMPFEHPEVVVVTMTEHGGFGGSTSAPVTAAVLQTWFTKVRGVGRYKDYPALPAPKHVYVPPVETKKEPAEETPATATTPEVDPKAPADAPNVMPTTPAKPVDEPPPATTPLPDGTAPEAPH
ncbi:MAG TPA: penicillin-binding transpeptidase domain-containing protein, partial [Myxococcota bacterium]